MRIAVRLAGILVLVAACLPLGGCLGLLVGYVFGEMSGESKASARASGQAQVERRTQEAVWGRTPSDRLRALAVLRSEAMASKANYVPRAAWYRGSLESKIPRIAEALEDPDREVREAARALLELLAGDDAWVSPKDLAAVESKTDDWPEALPRLESAAVRTLALARLGRDVRGAVALLRRGAATDDPSLAAVSVFCALALHAATGETEPVLPALVRGLEKGFVVDVRIAAALGLGRLGAPARLALDALIRAEGEGSVPLRRAAASARTRIAAALRPRTG